MAEILCRCHKECCFHYKCTNVIFVHLEPMMCVCMCARASMHVYQSAFNMFILTCMYMQQIMGRM
jgi:hypothetical protein